jgi:uncharacterized membrane protein YbhN (UPF0104 family)|nr:lysylphosphatidylglycerol synthase transmembrane domain-containing protein [Kofleriaceae bacterium]
MTLSRAIRLLIAVVVVAMIALYVRDFDWAAIGDYARHASIPLLAVATLGNLPLIWMKALRLRTLVTGSLSTPRLMRIYVASYAADNLLMSQAGIGVRVALLARDGVALAAAVTTQVVEKVLEGIGLAVIALPLLGWDDLDGPLRTTLKICLGLGAGGAVALAGLALVRGARSENRIVKRVAEVAAVLRRPGPTAQVMAFTLAAWAVEYAMIVASLAAVGLELDPLLPLAVLVAVNLAALIPGLPANIGPFEMACVVVLGAAGVSQSHALGFAILYHVLHTLPVTVAGLAAPIRQRST